MKLKIQIGVEAKGAIPLRLTPIDQVLPDLPDGIESLIAGLVLMADGKDAQPGDGEVDLPLTDALKKIMGLNPEIAKILPADANAFIKVKQVA
jgi:hypothetical protein